MLIHYLIRVPICIIWAFIHRSIYGIYKMYDPSLTWDFVSLLDVDFNLHANNSIYNQYFERARWAHAILSKNLSLMTKDGYNPLVMGSVLRYRRSLPLFAIIRVKSQIIGFDDKFEYWSQKIYHKNRVAAAVVFRVAFVKGGKVIPSSVIARKGLEITYGKEWADKYPDSKIVPTDNFRDVVEELPEIQELISAFSEADKQAWEILGDE